jgi:hypothetical protein
VLKAINAEALFLSIYRKRFTALCLELIELLNLRISASKKDSEENLNLVREMEESVQKIERKAENLVSDIEGRYSKVAVNDLVSAVGTALDAALPEIAALAQKGNKDGVEFTMNEVVRSSLTSAIKDKLGSIVNDITVDLSSDLTNLGVLMENYGGGENYIDNFVQKTQALINDMQLTGEDDEKSGKSRALGGAYKAVATVISFISGGVISILEAVIIFLPEIFGPILGFFQKKQQENEIRAKFQTQVFPSIKSKIRQEIPAFLDNAIKQIIVDVRGQYTKQIEQQRAEVSAGIEAAKAGAEEQARKIEALSAAAAKVRSIAEEAQKE